MGDPPRATSANPHPDLPFHLALRAHASGVLVVGARVRQAPYCVDPERGLPVLELDPDEIAPDWLPDPAEPACSLLIPDESASSLQLLGMPRPLDPERDAAGDRYLAYHRRRERASLAWFAVESAKLAGEVLDAFCSPNPLGRAEFALLRRAHADGALARALGARLGTPDVRVVGIDHLGVDVRAGLGVHRVPFAEPCADAGAVERAIARLAGVGA